MKVLIESHIPYIKGLLEPYAHIEYLEPEQFNETIRRSIRYVIMFDGTCYKLAENRYLKCKLDGDEGYFTNLYLGQPHEVDANTFAYEQTRKICGDLAELKDLFDFWMPRQVIPDKEYDMIFALIDEKTKDEKIEVD